MRYPPQTLAAPFRSLSTPAQLDELIASSFQRPVVIFKHSFTCGTSAEAYEDLSEGADQAVTDQWYLVDVRANRPLSQLIAERFAVRHESPQALVIVAGQVRWSGSHYRVTTAAVRAALAELTTA